MSSGDPPPAAPGAPRRLVRSRSDRVIAGVCGGLGRYFGIDPVIVRIAAVALALFGGAGILLYIAAVLLVPDEAEVPAGSAAVPASPPTDRNKVLVVLGIVLLVLVAGPLLFGSAFLVGGVAIPLAFVALLGLLTAWLVTGRKPEREAGALVRATLLGLGVLLLVGVLAVGSFLAAGYGGGAVVAALVIAAGVAVLAGAFLRPARWLVLPALALAVPAGFVSAANIDLDGGWGDKTYRPASAQQLPSQYEIGAGQLTVDLRGTALRGGDQPLKVRVGMGEAVVIVPDDVCVATRAKLGMGGVDVFNRNGGGIDVDFVDDRGPARSGTRLILDADIGLGHLDVRHTAPSGQDWQHWGDRYDGGDTIRGTNAACASA